MLTVKVTQQHIDKGRRRVPDCCPVFHALRPLIKDHYDLSVIHSKAITVAGADVPQRFRILGRILQGSKEPRSFMFPEDTRSRISRYDQGADMEPFEFEFKIPNKYLK